MHAPFGNSELGTGYACMMPKLVSPEFLIGLKTGPNYECSMKTALLYDGTGTGMFTVQPDMNTSMAWKMDSFIF